MRTLRALRPLRAMSRMQGMRVRTFIQQPQNHKPPPINKTTTETTSTKQKTKPVKPKLNQSKQKQ